MEWRDDMLQDVIDKLAHDDMAGPAEIVADRVAVVMQDPYPDPPEYGFGQVLVMADHVECSGLADETISTGGWRDDERSVRRAARLESFAGSVVVPLHFDWYRHDGRCIVQDHPDDDTNAYLYMNARALEYAEMDRANARILLADFAREIDAYLQGDVFCAVVMDHHGKTIEDTCGFYGEAEYAAEAARELAESNPAPSAQDYARLSLPFGVTP